MACWWGRGDPAAVATLGVPCGSGGVAACSVAEVLPGAWTAGHMPETPWDVAACVAGSCLHTAAPQPCSGGASCRACPRHVWETGTVQVRQPWNPSVAASGLAASWALVVAVVVVVRVLAVGASLLAKVLDASVLVEEALCQVAALVPDGPPDLAEDAWCLAAPDEPLVHAVDAPFLAGPGPVVALGLGANESSVALAGDAPVLAEYASVLAEVASALAEVASALAEVASALAEVASAPAEVAYVLVEAASVLVEKASALAGGASEDASVLVVEALLQDDVEWNLEADCLVGLPWRPSGEAGFQAGLGSLVWWC
uniref:Uncharacterized protein n=1 Tax=Ixodes ricinus TaxID=34613 RepID=A0A6B0V775_IXORI